MGRAFGQFNNLLSAAEEYGMLQRGDKVLIALSGGADSTALTVLLNEQRDAFGISLHVAHLNHCLRGEESDRDEKYVRELCESLGLQLTVKRSNVSEAASASRTGIEETARRIRYSFLEETAEIYNCTKIATAHNLNDNAETFIINAVRGAGLRGLAGIPPIRGSIIRPLIFSSREAIEKFLNERGIRYVIDSTNTDTKFIRNKVRHDILPLLCGINPSFIENIADITKLIHSDADYLDDIAESVLFERGEEPSISRNTLCELPEGIAGRVIRLMHAAAFRRNEPESTPPELSLKHTIAVLKLASGSSASGEIYLPGRIVAYCRYNELAMRKVGGGALNDSSGAVSNMPGDNVHGSTCSGSDSPEAIALNIGLTRFGRWTITAEVVSTDAVDAVTATSEGIVSNDNSEKCICNSQIFDIYSTKITDIIDTVYLKYVLIEEGLVVRGYKTGDSLSPEGHSWTKTLKKLYIDMKIPRHMRADRPVIATNESVCAVPGYRADRKHAAKPGQQALKLIFRLST